jgi:hypothetical protein
MMKSSLYTWTAMTEVVALHTTATTKVVALQTEWTRHVILADS